MVSEFLCGKLTMYTTNVIVDGVLPGVQFALSSKGISFKRRANYMKLGCVKGNLVIICTLKTPIKFPLSQLLNTNYIKFCTNKFVMYIDIMFMLMWCS